MTSQQDLEWMHQAIALGEKGRINAPPNPWVGCIIVKEGNVIGKGYHVAAGKPHAESMALKEAGVDAIGATAYITLEPCCHHGKTPPCANALIESGIARVVIALQDPDPKVNGKGVQLLKEAGISVEVGVLATAAESSLKAYLHHRKTGKAFCIAKAAMSVDGRTAASDGSSQWISPPAARTDAHRLRAESQAILIGSNTALKDQPLLTVREGPQILKQPLRVVLDTNGKVELDNSLCNTDFAPTLIITSKNCPESVIEGWKACGVEVEILPLIKDAFKPEDILSLLGEKNILQVLVEGGSTVLGSFMNAQSIDRLVLYVGQRILGDKGYPLFKNLQIGSIDEAPVLKLIHTQIFDGCVRLEYSLKS